MNSPKERMTRRKWKSNFISKLSFHRQYRYFEPIIHKAFNDINNGKA